MKLVMMFALWPISSMGHGAPSLNVTGTSCPAGVANEAGQACQLQAILHTLYSSLLCPHTIPKLCDTISQTLDVLEGKGRPVLADQRYLADMLKMALGYSKAFFGQSEQCCAGGDQSCCNHARADFPGPEAQSYLTSTEIAAKMAAVPSLQASGRITRRNMLGYLLLNDLYWFDLPEGERGLGLGGQSMTSHRFVRPKLDSLLGKGAWDAAAIEKSAHDFISAKSEISFQDDVKIWTQQVLHRVVYHTEISEQEAKEFAEFQGKVLKTVVLPQFIVDAARSIPGGEMLLLKAIKFEEIKAQKEAYLKRWLPIVTARYCKGCDAQQARVVNTNFMDALVFAGGLSVPGVIAPGVATLHAGDRSPAPGLKLTAANAQAFAYEATRYFPPVLGFPYVDESQARPLQIMALGVGQRSAEAWGEDAGRPAFRLRDVATYQKWWVGHADHADDPKGEMTRRCPAQALSMTMIGAWFKAWDQAAWAPKPGTHFRFNDFVLFVLDFKMVRASRDDDVVV